MFNVLTKGLPNDYKGFELDTSFRTALRIQEILDDPRYNTGSQIQRMAAFIAAISLLYKDKDVVEQDKLGINGAIKGILWWLSCGNDDRVENYWKSTGIMPDVESIEFDSDDYNSEETDMITIDYTNGDGSVVEKEVSKYAILKFKAPDGTFRYKREKRGEPELLSMYEDNQLIYSGFYVKFGIDLASDDIHWFTFCMLLAELESTDGTALYNKIKVRSFNPADYKGKGYAEYRNKMEQEKKKSRVLGILPYIDKEGE